MSLLCSYEINLAKDLARLKHKEAQEEQLIWIKHYKDVLIEMYRIFRNGMEEKKLSISVSFKEFVDYVYKNTLCYVDPQLHKRVRPLD